MIDHTLPELDSWRAALRARPGVSDADVDELTDHLLGVVDSLTAVGLTRDEAFLIAVRRIGQQDAVARELAFEHTDRLWKQLLGAGTGTAASVAGRDVAIMLAFAAAAGLAVRIPLGPALTASQPPWLGLLVAICALGFVFVAWWAWRHRPRVVGVSALVAVSIAVGGLSQALFPFAEASDTRTLGVLHLPILVGIVLGVAYLGHAWRDVDRWQDYVRFLGELLIYYTLIALGGSVLMGLAAELATILDLDWGLLYEWGLPLGAGGALIVAAWLVEAKQSVVENMAPVLTAVFTPLFTLLMLGFLVAMAATGSTGANRHVLIVIDLVLVVVWGLVLFTVSARPDVPPRLSDWLLVALMASALVVDVVVLAALAGRVGEFGASPNKLAALGENVVVLVSLAGSLWLFVGFLRGRRGWRSLERWQSRYLLVVGAWAAVVVFVFPLVFGFR